MKSTLDFDKNMWSEEDNNSESEGKIMDIKNKKVSVSKEDNDDEEMIDVPSESVAEHNRIKIMPKNRQRRTQKKALNNRSQPQKKTVNTGLDGKYWNEELPSDRDTDGDVVNYRQLNGDDSSGSPVSDLSSDSSSEDTTDASSFSEEDDDNNDLLFKNNTFVTCRSPADSFYLCQVLQDVYSSTKIVRIRWCSIVNGNDDTKIGTKTSFKLDYKDKLDPEAILLGIENVIHHDDNTISLKKQDIVETKRLLEKSIHGESLSSDDMMDLSTEDFPKQKPSSHLYFESSDANDSSTSSSEASTVSLPTTKKRKRPLNKQKSRKQPVKKRAHDTSNTARQRRSKTSGVTTNNGKVKRRSTKANSDQPANEDGKKRSKKIAKPKPISKAQLFKVHSNRLLKENTTIKLYKKEPFFEDNVPVPFISSIVQSKLAIRAVILNDSKLLKSLINDVDHVCSVHVPRGLHNDLTALNYAIKNNNINMAKILLDDINKPKKDRCSLPTVSMKIQSTGRANIRTLGFRTAKITASRGAKEGNNALNKDQTSWLRTINGNEILVYALKNNCSPQLYDLILKTYEHSQNYVYDNIHKIIQAGHRKLAAHIVENIKDNQFYGFNNLHYQVLLYDNEDLTINRAASVLKKTKSNFMITPIHCAAINPNAKYLKQLLNVTPEYNMLDKYERRPIHFAAACEGPDPLEYLLSKHVNFNDVDRGGNAPLHIAVINGRALNVELLLRTAKDKSTSNEDDDDTIEQKFGLASINRMNKNRFYPVHLAVLNNHLNCLKILIEYGASVDIGTSASSGKLTPLMLACQKGNLDIAKYLIEKGAKVEARDRFKRTPLIHACMCGNAHIVSHLLHLGANADVFDSSLNTALHYAIAYGWYFCVQSLLEAGANLNCVNSWQTTCLGVGFLKGHFGICDYLLTYHNADINFKTDDGLTIVMLTADLEITPSAVEQLEYAVQKHKADCTTTDANGNNALHYLAANKSIQNTRHLDDQAKKTLHDSYCKMADILLASRCDPNKTNNKAQTPLMTALETGNLVLVDYFINKAKIQVNADISYDGKTLLHYFAKQCHKSDLIESLLKLPINQEIKKMGQVFDNSGRTPFHYCAAQFNEFCEKYKASKGNDRLKLKYRSIVRMIEYCLESAECDPDIPIKSIDGIKQLNPEQNQEDDDDDDDEDDNENTDEKDESEEEEKESETEEENENETEEEEDDETSNENPQPVDDSFAVNNETSVVKPKETSIFHLLRTVPFIDNVEKHPLELFLKKTKNLNVLHHETHRTAILEAIYLRQSHTATMLIQNSLCDINLATSKLANECQKTPLLLACTLQLLSVVRNLLENEQCNISLCDSENNQAIHYYLKKSNRSSDYLDTLNLFIKKLKAKSYNALNFPGKHQRTPLHIAVYHNLGTIDAIIDIEKVLIENGSDLMMKDDLGNIPLHNVFLNKTTGSDPVELCVLLMKAMKYKSLDTTNNQGDTPLHLAVTTCSTVCVMLLQQHNASLFIENNLSNSIIGTCIASGHLNLFITFLQQSIDIDLGKLHKIPIEDVPSTDTKESTSTATPSVFGNRGPRRGLFPVKPKQTSTRKKVKSLKKDNQDDWKWACCEKKTSNKFDQYSLIYLIIQQDWQGALSLTLNEIDRFHLNYLQIIEAAILNNKLNLVLRLLLRLKDDISISDTNLDKQNLFHLLANMKEYNESLLKQVLLFLYESNINWCKADKHGSYPLHYACARRNFTFIEFLRDKYPLALNLNQTDSFGNTAVSLLFWSLPCKKTFPNEKIRSLITSGKQLNCLCNYDNTLATNPLSFGCANSIDEDIVYPSTKSDIKRTSPLIHAIAYNNFQLVKFLLEFDLDVNYHDENERTPMMHAILQNNIDIVKLLMNKNYTLEDDQTPAPVSVLYGRKAQPKARRKFYLGVTKSTRNKQYTTNKNKSKKFQKVSSVDLNATDAHGRTCIHYLVEPFSNGSYTNSVDILHLLHGCGAVLTVSDHSGLTPIDYAVEKHCVHFYNELVSLLPRQQTSTLKPKYESFDINDPNKNLLNQRINFYSDAQDYIDKYISLHAKTKFNNEYRVDPLSGMSLTGEVLIDTDKNEPYDVRLTKADISYGIFGFYNFYRMQIIKHKSKNNLYCLFTRWGRIGDAEGQYQLTPFSTLDECRTEFLKVFREKTGNHWKDTDQFEVKPKKYSLVRLNEREMKKYPSVPIDFDRLQAEHEHPPSKLQSTVYTNLMQTLINRQAIRKNIHKTQLDVTWMPVSQLKRETLDKARDLLGKIKKTLEKRDQLQQDRGNRTAANRKLEIKAIIDSISQYTNEYYTLIPLNGFDDQKLPAIENEDALKQQGKILDDLFELELSYKMLLGAQANLKSMAPSDYLYKSMNCQFELMNKNDMESQLMLRYIWATEPTIQIEQIFKIARPNEDERLAKCKVNNHYLLWHGTNICNLISILTRGLLVGSLAGTSTGSLFGKGIYTADSFSKSLGYCSGVQQKNGERCFMLLCEVALGKIKECGLLQDEDNPDAEEEDDNNYDKPLDFKRFQSRKGVGKRIPDPKHTITLSSGVQMPLGQLIDNKNAANNYYGLNYNEYIVYDEAQVAIRYLIQFRQ